MSGRMKVRVHYPASRGRIVLRTDLDWERDLEPVAPRTAPDLFDFRVELDGSHRYFKPVFLDDNETRWALGDDSLAVANGHDTMDVYPHFFGDNECTECTLRSIASRDGSRTHPVRVYLPPGYYENTLERYPVLYMQDGQNLFFPDEAFAGETWKIQDTFNVLGSMNLVRKTIVVGIHPLDRMRDYTADGCEAYGRFLVEEAKPWIDAHYRTMPGPRETAVLGSSLGGVVSLYLGWEFPEVFGSVGCLSSTFGYRDDLARRVATEAKRDLRIYLDSGWPGDNYEVTRGMRNALVRRGYRPGRDLLYLAFPQGRHEEQSWAARAHIPFQFFFAA